MTSLVWDQIDARRYEAGVSHGVFYPIDEPGVVWNGLVSITDQSVGAEQVSYYLDGVKYLDVIGSKDYQAVVTALSAPEGFASYMGDRPVVPGFRLAKQSKRRFNFSYQTIFGEGYKIHLIYNVLATLTTMRYATINNVSAPSVLIWTFDATPVVIPGFRPSAHYTIDSTKTDLELLDSIEDILYGTDISPPEFPTIEELIELFIESELP